MPGRSIRPPKLSSIRGPMPDPAIAVARRLLRIPSGVRPGIAADSSDTLELLLNFSNRVKHQPPRPKPGGFPAAQRAQFIAWFMRSHRP